MTGSLIVKLGSSGGGSSAWGAITGTLSDQLDLQAALDLKANLNSPDFQGRVNVLGTGVSSGQLHLYDADSTSSVALVTSASLAANFAITLPAETGTMALRGSNTFTGIQTITPAVNAKALIVTGVTHTASAPIFDLSQTWNNGGVVFEGLCLNVTNTASAALSTLLDLKIGGSSKFTILNAAASSAVRTYAQVTGATVNDYIRVGFQSAGIPGIMLSTNAGGNKISIIGDTTGAGAAGEIRLSSDSAYAFTNATNGGTADAWLYRRAAAHLGLGAASATPITQTFGGAQGSGTNIAGGALNIGTRGTGTGVGGVINFQCHAAGSSGSTLGTLATVMSISSATLVTLASGVDLQLGNAATTGLSAGALAALTNASITLKDSTGQTYRIPCII